MRSLTLGLIFTCLSLSTCKTLRPQNAELSSLTINCQEPIALQAYLKAESSCTADAFFEAPAAARKRDLSPWIPCNDVEWIDDTQDLFGPGAGNDAETLELATYQRIYRDWLGKADRWTPDMVSKVFQKLDQPLSFQEGNPILDSAMARAVKDLIQNAEHNIVMDAHLLGGGWGADILHDMAAAAERGVEVILIHDSSAKAAMANETTALWQAAQQFSLKYPRFVVLEAATRSLQKAPLPQLTEDVLNGNDRSQVLIVDSLYQTSPDEYAKLKARALVMSRNLTDSQGSFDHDEGIIIRGPAAVITLLHYQADLRAAWEQAKKSKRVNAADENQLQSIHDRLEKLRQTPTLVKGQGWVSVQPIQINADDSSRNLDAGIIPRIMAAEHSIDLYGPTAFNWPLAMALKESMARGVKVRILLDQKTIQRGRANALLPYMLMTAPRRLPTGQETRDLRDESGKLIKEGDLPIRWFLPFRPTRQFASKDRSDLMQELHATTIIIDSRLALFGSASLDSLSWAAALRDYSVWVDDPALASESARQFDRLWNHPFLSVSHKVWLGDEEPAKEILQVLTARGDKAPEAILQGGKTLPDREAMKVTLATEADRSRLLIPGKILQDDQGRPQCRKL